MTLNSRLVNLASLARQMVESGLLLAYGGSISLRWQDDVYISPRQARLDRIASGDFIRLDLHSDNSWRLAQVAPEHAVHLTGYRARADVFTVFHLALPHCVALGCAGLGIEVLTPSYRQIVGSAAPLLAASSEDETAMLSAVSQTLVAHNALLLPNQGVLVVAASSDEALLRAQAVEQAAHITLLALAAAGQCRGLAASPS